jgi:hypothetical protein
LARSWGAPFSRYSSDDTRTDVNDRDFLNGQEGKIRGREPHQAAAS